MKNIADELIEQLNNPGIEIDKRIEIVRELGRLNNKRTVEPLLVLLSRCLGHYEERSLTSSIIEVLGKLGKKKAGKLILKALDNSPFFSVKATAAESIGKIEFDESAINKLKEIVYSDMPKSVKKGAIKGLGNISDEKVIDSLVDVLKKIADRQLKKEIIQSLGKRKSEKVVTFLMHFYYKEADEEFKEAIIDALSQIATFTSLEFLSRILEDMNPKFRAIAALALGKTRNKIAETSLKGLLDDPVEEVRKSAAEALGLIRDLSK